MTDLQKEIEDMYKMAEIFGDASEEKPDLKDILINTNQKIYSIDSSELLKFIIEQNLLNRLGDKIQFEFEDMEGISEEQLNLIADKVGRITLKGLKGITKEKLEILGVENYYIPEDLSSERNLEYVTSILSVLEEIKQSIPENATDLEKFMTVYKSIALSADYDYSLMGPGSIARTLKGVLIDGRAVCGGYSLALKYALQYVGIDSKMVSGYVMVNKNEGGPHGWNQVKIDGNWYNTDLTGDRKKIRSGEKLPYCLKSDEEFSRQHYADPMSYPEQCNVSYPEDIIQETLLETRTELDEYRENFGKGYPKLMSLSDYKAVAENTIIEPQISGDINRLVNERGDRENQR